jgi:RNA polymerase sigma-70 factor (ECF subfamily)
MRGCDCPPDDCAARVGDYLAGHRDAGDALVRKFTPLVRAIAGRVLGPDARGEEDDACQAVFLKVFASLKTWEGRCPFCNWVAVVATRRILDFAQAARSIPPALVLPPDLADPHAPPLAPEVVECLEQMLVRLPPDWRRAFEMAAQGEGREAIASNLGKSLRTIHYWLAAIREEMQDCLGRPGAGDAART